MSKYEPLSDYLKYAGKSAIPLTFDQIEKILGAKLPASAYKYRAWWSNNPSNSVMTHSWLRAGYKSESVDMESCKLVFRKSEDTDTSPSEAESVSNVTFGQIYGCMAGTIRVSAEFDITRSVDEMWDAEAGKL